MSARLLVVAAALVTPQSLKFFLNMPAMSQLSYTPFCTSAWLHLPKPAWRLLTLSSEDVPGQTQSPGYKNASRYWSSNLPKKVVQSSLDAAKQLVVVVVCETLA